MQYKLLHKDFHVCFTLVSECVCAHVLVCVCVHVLVCVCVHVLLLLLVVVLNYRGELCKKQ